MTDIKKKKPKKIDIKPKSKTYTGIKNTKKSNKSKNKKKKEKGILNKYATPVYLLMTIIIILVALMLIMLGKMYLYHDNTYIAGQIDEQELFQEAERHSTQYVQDEPKDSINKGNNDTEKNTKSKDNERIDKSITRSRPKGSGPPKIAIVIDDCGGNITLLRELLKLPVNTTPAILPHLEHSRQTYNILLENGIMPILHQPMEAISTGNNTPNPGEGALYVGMSKEEVYRILDDNINSMGYFSGANNHMGSLTTSDYNTMLYVLSYFKEKGMFFLDSRTTHHTVVPDIAHKISLPFLERDLFLDNQKDLALIIENLRALTEIAFENGYAVGIGHLHRTTIDAIRIYAEEVKKQGDELDFVFIHEILMDVYGFGDVI